MNIGELFLSLGFQVDDKQLKSFNEGITDAFHGMMRLAGVTATAAGFTFVLNKAADASTHLRNLSMEYGVNAREFQEWAAIIHQSNPLVSLEEGRGSMQHFIQYLNEVNQGLRSSEALRQLGVNFKSGDQNHPMELAKQVQANMAFYMNTPGFGPGYVKRYTDELWGNVEAMTALNKTTAEWDEMKKVGIISGEDNDALAKYNDNLAVMSTRLEQIKAHIAALAAPHVSKILEAADKGVQTGSWWNFIDTVGAEGDLTHYLSDPMKHLIERAAHALSNQIIKDGDRKNPLPAMYSPDIAVTNTTSKRAQAEAYFMSMGFSSYQAAGMVDRLVAESGLNEKAYGTGKEAKGKPDEAYGAAQWHPDRQRDFAKQYGHDIHNSTFSEQLSFIGYELTKGAERRAGEQIMSTGNRADAAATMNNAYERSAITISPTIHINSNADPKATADETVRQIQAMFDQAGAQRNLGAEY